MNLAQRLNELAQANANGLLSDDEYRLLRQSAFGQYSGNDVPAEHSIVPTTPSRIGHEPHIPISPSTANHPGDRISNRNQGLQSSISTFLRRATGRGSPAAPSDPLHMRNPGNKAISPTTPESGSKRRFIPRLFGRKPELPPLRISSTQSYPNMRSPQTPQSPSTLVSTSLSPSRSIRFSPKPSRDRNVSSPQGHGHRLSKSISKSINDDQTLLSSKDIQDTILSLENELCGLVDAFDNLEHAAIRRIQKQCARRLPANTPASVDVLIEGREWREHRIVPSRSPSTLSFNGARTPRCNDNVALEPVNDRLSVYSGHSGRTSMSMSKSNGHISYGYSHSSSLSPTSPTRSIHFRTQSTGLQRKASVSSVSSKSVSILSSSRPGVSPAGGSSISHSSSYLPLHAARALSSVDDDGVLEDPEDEAEQLSELCEIQQRRDEVISRYTRRIEYLKAKHKGAELHERVLRK